MLLHHELGTENPKTGAPELFTSTLVQASPALTFDSLGPADQLGELSTASTARTAQRLPPSGSSVPRFSLEGLC